MSNPFSNVEKVNAIIRVRRGPEVDRTLNIYDSGELIFSTDKKRLFIGDSIDNGATGAVGGIVVGNKNWVTNNFEKLSGIVTYDTVYRTDTSNYYLFVGSDYLRPDNYILINTTGTSGGGSYTLPAATSSILGGVIIKDGLVVTNGYLRVDVDNSTIKIDPSTKKLTAVAGTGGGGSTENVASENTLGIVKVPLNGGIKISSGDLSVNVDNSTIKLSSTSTGSKLYVDGSLVKIPVATSSNLGVIKTGNGVTATSNGTLNLRIASVGQIGGVKVGSGLTIDSSDGELSVDGTIYDSVPIGTVHWYAISAAPTGYLECNGDIVTVTDYDDLFQVIGTTYNDGLSTQYYNSSDVLTGFRIPDLRGEFIRGWDDGRGVDTGRTFASSQSASFLYTHVGINSDSNLAIGGQQFDDIGTFTSPTYGLLGTPTSTPVTGPKFAMRPRNVALLPCIKALKTVNNIVVPTGDYIPKPPLPNDKDILIFEDEYGTGGSWTAAPSTTYAGEALLSATGYQKLPSGLIMQWGDLPTTAGNQQSVPVVFAIPFPTAVVSFNITANTNNRSGNMLNVWSVYNHTLSGFTARTQDNDTTPYEGWWVAMGY